MHTIDPAMMLAVHHVERRHLTDEGHGRPVRRSRVRRAVTGRARAIQVAVLRRAYVRARAAQARARAHSGARPA